MRWFLTGTRAVGKNPFEGRSQSEGAEEASLLPEGEVRRLPLDEIVVVVDPQMPIRAKRVDNALEFVRIRSFVLDITWFCLYVGKCQTLGNRIKLWASENADIVFQRGSGVVSVWHQSSDALFASFELSAKSSALAQAKQSKVVLIQTDASELHRPARRRYYLERGRKCSIRFSINVL